MRLVFQRGRAVYEHVFVCERRTWRTLSSIPQMTRTKALIQSTNVNIMCTFELGGLRYDSCECAGLRVNVSIHALSCGRQRQSHFSIRVFSLDTLTHIAASAHACISACVSVGLVKSPP